MGFSEALQWWEEWQLRLLVLGSLFLQCFLFVSSLRKCSIPSWFRFLIWLAYLGSDAVAMYALATLFNRRKNWMETTEHSSSNVEVLWAPILLMHLGGLSGITAYDIEDNELWRRHVLTAVSQVTVAIYVFYKSSSPGDERAMQIISYCLFFAGIVKCLLKPWEFKKVSINSLVGSSASEDCCQIKSLGEFVKAAAKSFQSNTLLFGNGGYPPDAQRHVLLKELCNLCVDRTPPYSKQLSCLKYLSFHQEKAHDFVKLCLSMMFDRLYTKDAILMSDKYLYNPFKKRSSPSGKFWNTMRFLSSLSAYFGYAWFLAGIHRKAYNDIDVKITYTLMALTFLLDLLGGCYHGTLSLRHVRLRDKPVSILWPDEVAQYNLIEYLTRNTKHRSIRKLGTLLVCKDYLDQLWCMKPSRSSPDITKLVHAHIRAGWKQIYDVTTYRRFNDSRGQWTLEREGLLSNLMWSLRRPFDESVLLWHLATDFYIRYMDTPPNHEVACRC